ncbi:ParB/RepB/Spo0J family partition protein [Halovivax gelatinilyticus]|uniref:ParB/RepB/Spo0J family partition protein n=1 Tax=Halovivax gelatinilyticus TaxID=2961597 RepID=UPI0020CA369A|nr:ParB N-terminal domain-containing protein [Halovivax gelatinilyticus]
MNPFNNSLDWSFRGKYVRVYGTKRVYEGWVDRIHHKRSSLVIHDAVDITDDETRKVGSVYVRVVEVVETLSPSKRIELVPVDEIEPSPYHDQAFEPSDEDMRYAYRDQFTGSYPVVRPIDDERCGRYELVNGHKRIEACRRVGLATHPVEVVEATDEEARELFELAHRDQVAPGEDSDSKIDSGDTTAHQDGVSTDGDQADKRTEVERTDDRDDGDRVDGRDDEDQADDHDIGDGAGSDRDADLEFADTG